MGLRRLAYALQRPYNTQLRGQYTFNGAWITAPLADFMLGMMSSSARLLNVNRNYLRATSRGAFFNDDFKLLPNLHSISASATR